MGAVHPTFLCLLSYSAPQQIPLVPARTGEGIYFTGSTGSDANELLQKHSHTPEVKFPLGKLVSLKLTHEIDHHSLVTHLFSLSCGNDQMFRNYGQG